ncbi:hypothetical protein [Carboxylicivirga caseinilyticus]|uniref:hypothetical protein n=1 Tax=Carboxylicivirga caseinilyticus TaxID=3417572 RepID=UPI003D32BE13|nr:hypothetical protein [Marinilabiliaceae bacterium A049]
MIKKTTIALLLATILIPALQAKESSKDTLRLIMPNNVQIDQLVYFQKPKDVIVLKEVKTYLESFLNDFKKLDTDELNADHPVKFIYKKGDGKQVASSITFDEYQAPTTIILTMNESAYLKDSTLSNEILINKRIHRLELSSNNHFNQYKAFIHFNSIEQLDELLLYDFEKIIQNVEELLSKKENKYASNKLFTAYIRIDSNAQPDLIKIDIARGPMDVIQLSAGSGLQSLKGQWLGSFNAQAAIIFTRKGIDKHAFSFTYEWMYNFTTPDQKYVNEFIDLGYSYNFSRTIGKDEWVGLTFGFMTKQRGEFFANNTYRLGLNTRLNKHLGVGPQIYFNDFFQNVYPGINVSISIM